MIEACYTHFSAMCLLDRQPYARFFAGASDGPGTGAELLGAGHHDLIAALQHVSFPFLVQELRVEPTFERRDGAASSARLRGSAKIRSAPILPALQLLQSRFNSQAQSSFSRAGLNAPGAAQSARRFPGLQPVS